MNKMVTTGLIAGGVLGAAGLSWMMADRGTKKRIMKSGGKMAKKASQIVDM